MYLEIEIYYDLVLSPGWLFHRSGGQYSFLFLSAYVFWKWEKKSNLRKGIRNAPDYNLSTYWIACWVIIIPGIDFAIVSQESR